MESPENEDRWYVNVGGTPKMMNLDEIVAAFEAGTINGKTLVTEVGGSEWKPLKEVADLGDDEEPAAQVPAAAAPVVMPSIAAQAPVAKTSVPPSIRATQSGWPPVVAASRPPMSVAPAGTASASPSIAPSGPSPSMAPLSTMPVVQDLGLALDAEFKPRRSKAPVVAAAFVALFIGGVFGVGRLTGGGEVARPIPVPAAAPVAANTTTNNTTTTTTTTTTPVAPAPATTSDSSANSGSSSDKPASDKPSDAASSDTRLADEVKEKLKDADKSRADKKKAAKSARGHAASSRSKGSSSSGVFRAGGNANDPLNSKL